MYEGAVWLIETFNGSLEWLTETSGIAWLAKQLYDTIEDIITEPLPDIPKPDQTMLTAGITDTVREGLVELFRLAGVGFLWLADLVLVQLLGMDPTVSSADPMFVGTLIAILTTTAIFLTVAPLFKDIIDHPFANATADDPMKRDGDAMPESRNDNTEGESGRN